MTVLVTLRISGDPSRLEAVSAQDPAAFPAVLALAKPHGVISHHFYASEGQVLVVDEWPTEDAFRTFYEQAGPQIGAIMEQTGVTAPPEVTFWNKLDLGDDLG
jgi:hypothetical protein